MTADGTDGQTGGAVLERRQDKTETPKLYRVLLSQ